MTHQKADSTVTTARAPTICSRVVLASGCLVVTMAFSLSVSLYLHVMQNNSISVIQQQLDELRQQCAKHPKEQHQDPKLQPSEDLYFVDKEDRSPIQRVPISRTRQSSQAIDKIRVRRASGSEGSGRTPRPKLSKSMKKLIHRTVKKLLKKSDKKIAKSKEETTKEISSLKERVTELDRNVRLLRNATGSSIFGVHYVGDVAKVRHANGDVINGKFLRSSDGTFPDWTPAGWMSDYPYANKFQLQSDGGVRVKEGGLYWVYAQISFYNSESSNTMYVQITVKGKAQGRFISCSHSNAPVPIDKSPEEVLQAHTCFGGGLTRLEAGDEVQVVEANKGAVTYWTKDRAFIGLVRLA